MEYTHTHPEDRTVTNPPEAMESQTNTSQHKQAWMADTNQNHLAKMPK